jgi:hypothetical protein
MTDEQKYQKEAEEKYPMPVNFPEPPEHINTSDLKLAAFVISAHRSAYITGRKVSAAEGEKIWNDCERTVLAMQEFASREKFAEGLKYMKMLYFKSLPSPPSQQENK